MGTPMKRVVVMGAGAMGGFYASRFYELDTENIFLIADGARYERLKNHGLMVNGKRYDIPLIRPSEKVTRADLLLVAVKNQHLPRSVQEMGCCVGEGTAILSVMNGIDSEERIGAAHGKEKVLYALAVGIDAVKEGNNITVNSPGKIIFGEMINKTISDRVKRAQELLDRAGLKHETQEDMVRALWWKFMINMGVNQVSAVLRAPYGVFQKSQEARELMDTAMREVVMVAEKAGVALYEKDIQDWYSFLMTMGPHGKTSMVQDVEAKRKTEVEMFSGKLIELGAKYGVATPVNQALFRFIKIIEQSYL